MELNVFVDAYVGLGYRFRMCLASQKRFEISAVDSNVGFLGLVALNHRYNVIFRHLVCSVAKAQNKHNNNMQMINHSVIRSRWFCF